MLKIKELFSLQFLFNFFSSLIALNYHYCSKFLRMKAKLNKYESDKFLLKL